MSQRDNREGGAPEYSAESPRSSKNWIQWMDGRWFYSSSRLTMEWGLVESAVNNGRIRSLVPGTSADEIVGLSLILFLLRRRQTIEVELEFVRSSVFVDFVELS